MIRNFKHRGLKRLFEREDPRGINPHHRRKIDRVLAQLDIAKSADEMDIPGFNLHRLGGDLKGFWSVSISGNWRIIFRIDDGNACDVELIDYH